VRYRWELGFVDEYMLGRRDVFRAETGEHSEETDWYEPRPYNGTPFSPDTRLQREEPGPRGRYCMEAAPRRRSRLKYRDWTPSFWSILR